MTKLDEGLIHETPDGMLDSETLDTTEYCDEVVTAISKLRFELHNGRPLECPRPRSSQKFDGNRKNWQRFCMQFSEAVHNDEFSTADTFKHLNALVSGAAASAISILQDAKSVTRAQLTSLRTNSASKES
ncbi:hypothetical protein HPB49_020751 [Dermacentor silvarum]|uniref:Uncharacterized protein n=1 Tax=Dermacentor silvarum TaxID=543639 RepID=A0ACB8CH56_DERSI|nr:hypothetical protein HPB49_020751 [Dermacentor silvarum]